jgi:hypothetical protein
VWRVTKKKDLSIYFLSLCERTKERALSLTLSEKESELISSNNP